MRNKKWLLMKKRSHPNGWNKEKLVSRYVTEGVEEGAPHRSYYYAMGLTEERDSSTACRSCYMLE